MANRSLKTPISFRLSGDAVQLLKEMAALNGLSQAGILELAIREKATREGAKLPAIGAAKQQKEVAA